MTFATVKVFPDPVTPSSTWCCELANNPSVSFAIACGWSPSGSNGATSLNMQIEANRARRQSQRSPGQFNEDATGGYQRPYYYAQRKCLRDTRGLLTTFLAD